MAENETFQPQDPLAQASKVPVKDNLADSTSNENQSPGLMSNIREWAGLPNQIRLFPAKAAQKFDQIQNALVEYRLSLLRFTYKAGNIDAQVWDTRREIFDTLEMLNKSTRKITLLFQSLRRLRKMKADWEDLLRREDELLLQIRRARPALEFYNKMMTHKGMHHRERVQTEENTRKYQKAYQSLQAALEYVEDFNQKSSVGIFGASVLNFEEARQYWDEQLEYIREIEESDSVPVDRVIGEIDKLKNIMYEAPSLARWVNEVEKKVLRLTYDHELLVDSYGKLVVPDEEMRETRLILNEMVPKLWASGQREQLEHYLKNIETFVNLYEPQVQSEIAFAERHQPKRSVETREAATSTHDLRMITTLTKILMSAIESRESKMSNHSVNVARLAVETARVLKWSDEDTQYLEIAALLHDVGKVWIPESILTKQTPLTDEEMREMRKHPFYGAQILESFDTFEEIIPWIYYHQERWDGTGYPEGLRGDEIPVASSIIAVCEAFSAMTSYTHSDPTPVDMALERIKNEAGKQFNPNVVDAFVTAINNSM